VCFICVHCKLSISALFYRPCNVKQSPIVVVVVPLNTDVEYGTLVEGSRQVNAFMFGFGASSNVVLYDRLLMQRAHNRQTMYSRGEVVALFAHELGHWMGRHWIKLFLIHKVCWFAVWLIAAKIFITCQCLNTVHCLSYCIVLH